MAFHELHEAMWAGGVGSWVGYSPATEGQVARRHCGAGGLPWCAPWDSCKTWVDSTNCDLSCHHSEWRESEQQHADLMDLLDLIDKYIKDTQLAEHIKACEQKQNKNMDTIMPERGSY